jgi:hypothetical protein
MLAPKKGSLWKTKIRCVGLKTSWTAWSKKGKSRRSETFKQTTNNSCVPHVALLQEYLLSVARIIHELQPLTEAQQQWLHWQVRIP